MIRVDLERRRFYVAGRRVHHGDTGAVLVAVGLLLMVHDRADRSAWLKFSRL